MNWAALSEMADWQEPDHEARQHTSCDPDTSRFMDAVRRKANVKRDENIETLNDDEHLLSMEGYD